MTIPLSSFSSPILDHLFFALAGVDTTYIKVNKSGKVNCQASENLLGDQECDDLELSVSTLDFESVSPFSFLIINVRRFMNVPLLEPIIDQYFNKLRKLRQTINTSGNSLIEQLYLGVEEYFEIFQKILQKGDDISKAAENTSAIGLRIAPNHDNNSFNYCSDNVDTICNLNYYYVLMSATNWINYGIISKPEIISVNNYCEFNKCLYDDMFTVNKSISDDSFGNILPVMDSILECGKIVYFMRSVYEIDVSSNKGVDADNVSSNTKNPSFLDLSNITSLAPIRDRLSSLRNILGSITAEMYLKELQCLYDYILLRQATFLYEIFREINDLQNEATTIIDKRVTRSNAVEDNITSNFDRIKGFFKNNNATDLVEISKYTQSIDEYILQLHNMNFPTTGTGSYIGSNIFLNFTPRLLKFFLTPQLLQEINILSRFLIQAYFMEHDLSMIIDQNRAIADQNRTTDDQVRDFRSMKIVLLVLRNCIMDLNIEYKDNLSGHCSIVEIGQVLKKQIKELLTHISLTNGSSFVHWANLHNTVKKFIEINGNDVRKSVATDNETAIEHNSMIDCKDNPNSNASHMVPIYKNIINILDKIVRCSNNKIGEYIQSLNYRKYIVKEKLYCEDIKFRPSIIH